jgi:two-component system, chemotaxis family, chemotaxis protein CheY
MKILVTDDSRAMRMIVLRTLRQAGFAGHDVLEAENGKEALSMARSQKPDLILSDWNMPEMSGIDLLKALRGSGDTTPFCFVTSEGSDEMRAQAEQAGALGLIAKPFTAETFVDMLSPFTPAGGTTAPDPTTAR